MSELWDEKGILAVSGAFQTSRILISAAEIDLFSMFETGPKTVREICRDTGWDERGLRILMDALAAQGLLGKSPDDSYYADKRILKLLGRSGSESILPLILHRGRMWESWSKLTEIIRTGQNPNPLGMDSRSGREVEDFISAMHVVGSRLADKIASSIDLKPFGNMLDVGGGSGTYIIAFLKRAPQMKATLFDFPRVIEMGRDRLTDIGLIDRVNIVAGDYTVDELPSGHDLCLLSAVIHSNSRESNRMLYGKVFRALNPGGMVLIRDFVMESSRIVPRDGAIFAVNMLCATSGGDSYTLDEIKEDLESVGFVRIGMARKGTDMDQLVSSIKPM